MKYIIGILWAIIRPIPGEYDAKMSLRKHIKHMKESGYTFKSFDVDGHCVTIRSFKHVEDNSA